MNLVGLLIKDKWLKTPKIIEAFSKIKREDFMPDELKNLAESNEALPIGSGQTISQPLTVAFMLELLEPKPGDKVLDVGSGSGWTAAILAEIVSQNRRNQKPKSSTDPHSKNQKGRVVAIEILPDLFEFGRKNVDKYDFIKEGIVEYVLGDGSKGYAKQSPYDKILVSASASASREPEELKKQLKIGGRLVIPIKNSIWLFIKKNDNEFQKKEHPGFVFVPLV